MALQLALHSGEKSNPLSLSYINETAIYIGISVFSLILAVLVAIILYIKRQVLHLHSLTLTYTHNTLTIHSLQYTLLQSYTYYTLTIHSLYTHNTLTIHSQYTHNTLTVHSQYNYYPLTIHLLYTYYTLTIHSKYTHTGSILLIMTPTLNIHCLFLKT